MMDDRDVKVSSPHEREAELLDFWARASREFLRHFDRNRSELRKQIKDIAGKLTDSEVDRILAIFQKFLKV